MKHILHKTYHALWIISAIIVGIAAMSLLFKAGTFAYSYFNEGAQSKVVNEPAVTVQPTKETIEKRYYTVGSTNEPTTVSEGHLVADLETGQIITSNARKVALPIASVTKLMTALVAYTQIPQDNTTTVSRRAIATEGWRGGLEVGESVRTHDLLYPLLLESSNDASEVIAESMGRSNFMQEMNRKARMIGMRNTNFDDPSGLSSENTSTAEDLFVMLQYINRRYPEILDITRTESFSDGLHRWDNRNRIRSAEETFTGGKTGYTSDAQRTGLAVFTLPLSGGEERKIGVVILGSQNRERDIENLISYMQQHIHYGDQKSLNDLYRSNTVQY